MQVHSQLKCSGLLAYLLTTTYFQSQLFHFNISFVIAVLRKCSDSNHRVHFPFFFTIGFKSKISDLIKFADYVV